MYIPGPFGVTESGEIDDLLRRIPFGVLVTNGPGGIIASHLPVLHDAREKTLVGHIARANPHPVAAGDGEALMIFQGLNAYVTPNWYPSKTTHGRAVPTWNYEAVHVYGRLAWREDREWLRTVVAALSDRFEAGRPRPWTISDAPADYIDRLVAGIIGVELRIDRVEAKRKLSQNMSDADKEGVIVGLSEGGHGALASAMRGYPFTTDGSTARQPD